MKMLTLRTLKDGVALILLDTPGSSVNVLSRELFDEITPILDTIDGDAGIRCCVLASGKPGTFVAGANLRQLAAVASPEEGQRFSERGHVVLDRIAGSPKPFVAAVDGPALGGGLELALACQSIVASDSRRTVLGLPEVGLGLLPGGGGTQRLPRRIGLVESLPLLLTGRRVRAREALSLGLVDEVVKGSDPAELLRRAAEVAVDLREGRGPRRRPKRRIANRVFDLWPARRLALRRARAEARARSGGHYPAPGFILDCVEAGFPGNFAAGARCESRLFGELAAGSVAKSLIALFEASNALKRSLPGPEPRAVEHVGLIGAGLMGSGIATVSLPRARVTVKDVRPEALERCAKAVRAAVDRRVLRGQIEPGDRDAMLAGLKLTDRAEDLAGCDLVIEAVFEDLDLKHRVLAEIEQHVRPDAIIASNTSALPIGAIAKPASHPERVIGMHYFSPVPKMPLLELVVAARTAPRVVTTARAFAMRQGKTVIVVRDRPGFFTSRVLAPFLNEAAVLLREGAAIEAIDAGAVDFGFPVGPLTLLDALGIDVAAHVLRNLSAIFPHPEPSGGRALTTLFEAGFAGRKNGRGFYRYNEKTARGKQRPANPDVYGILGAAKIRELPAGEIATRLALSMANGATRCLHEEVIACPRDGDVGAVLGLGFPPFRGGPFRYVDGLGLRATVDALQRLSEKQGLRFEPAPLLKDMARENRRFYE